MRNNRYTIESVDNALQLILMLQSEGTVQLSQVARELGVARSTAHRLLGTLVRRGFAVQDDHRRYAPGPAISAAPVETTRNLTRLRKQAHSYLRALSTRSGETTHLMIREGAQVRFVDSVEGLQALRISSRIGVTLPAHVTSGGKALLAELDRQELIELYQEVADPPNLSSLLRVLTPVRQRGYGANIGESERGVTAVGVRVRRRDSASIAALTVSAPSIRLPRGRIPEVAEMLRAVVRQLESDLIDSGLEYSIT